MSRSPRQPAGTGHAPSRPSRRTVLRLAGLGLTLAGLPMRALAQEGPQEGPPPVGRPTWLAIPAIAVEASVEPVGLADDGTMGAPGGPFSLAWFEPGARPGELGNAVIAGHVDYRGVGPAVFWRLGDLAPGGEIFVDDETGGRRRFVVDEVARYAADAAPLERIFGLAGSPNLNLITCTGAFNAGERSYAERLVVYAHLAA